MKPYNYYIMFLCVVGGLISCKKNDEIKSPNKASVGILYAVTGSDAYKINFANSSSSWSALINFNYFNADGNASNNIAKVVGVPVGTPIALRSVMTMDTLHLIYNRTMQFMDGDNFTLLLSGTKDKVDTQLIKESITRQANDIAGIRFMNLSPNAGSVSVNLVGNAAGSEVNSLGYMAFTNFKPYKADVNQAAYTFEFRSVASGELLGTYRFTSTYQYLPRGANVTLVLRGLVSGNPGITVDRANNY